MTGLASKKIAKRSGLISGPPGLSVSGKDMSAAAARMPSFDFAQSEPTAASEGGSPAGAAAPGAAASNDIISPALGANPDVLLASVLATGAIVRLRVAVLVDSPYQLRLKYDEGKLWELAESLRNFQIDALLVRRLSNGKFEVISGHRRKRAAVLGELEELDCRVVEVSDAVARILVLAANEPREDFTDFERAHGYRAILEEGKAGGPVRTQKQLAAHIGVDAALINRRLSMLDLPPLIQEVLSEHPGAFSCRWVKQLLDLVREPYDEERLRATLLRVATGDLQMIALFSIMAGSVAAPSRSSPQRALSLHRGNRVFAQVTPHLDKRQVLVKLPGECDVQQVAELILAAIGAQFKGGAPSEGS